MFVVDRIMRPSPLEDTDVHIPVTCEYVKLQGNNNIADELMLLTSIWEIMLTTQVGPMKSQVFLTIEEGNRSSGSIVCDEKLVFMLSVNPMNEFFSQAPFKIFSLFGF